MLRDSIEDWGHCMNFMIILSHMHNEKNMSTLLAAINKTTSKLTDSGFVSAE